MSFNCFLPHTDAVNHQPHVSVCKLRWATIASVTTVSHNYICQQSLLAFDKNVAGTSAAFGYLCEAGKVTSTNDGGKTWV